MAQQQQPEEAAAGAPPPARSQAEIETSAREAAKGKKGEVLVVSYRDHHHAFSPSDPAVQFVAKAKPLSAPRRLLQFAFSAFMVHYFLWIFGMVGVLVLFYRCGLWYISAALLAIYIPTFLNKDEYKKGRPWHALRQWKLWHLTSRYIGVESVRTHKLDEKKQYMFGLYPHGILVLSRLAMYGDSWDLLFPGVETRVLGATPMFLLPGSREICLWMGAVNAAKRVAEKIYSKFKLSLMVYPGGSDEIFETNPSSPVTRLVMRTGFIRLAIQSGASIVPTHVFGEKWLYHRRPVPRFIHNFFYKRFKAPLICFWGRYFSWLPFHDQDKKFLSVVFGRPISVVQTAEPSDEYVNQVWAEFRAQQQAIFDEYKGKFGYAEDEVLEFKEAKKSGKERKKEAAAAEGADSKKKQ